MANAMSTMASGPHRRTGEHRGATTTEHFGPMVLPAAISALLILLAYASNSCTCSAFAIGQLPSRSVSASTSSGTSYFSSSDENAAAAGASAAPGNDGGDARKVLVLGGTGFVGSEVCRRLADLGIPYAATSTSGRGSTAKLDLTDPDAELRVADLVASTGSAAVISTVGSIGNPEDVEINAASGRAALGAKMGGATKFVFIGNDPKIRDLSKSIPFLKKYAGGKEEAEAKIRDAFGPTGGYCIIQPTFIFGGDSFGLNPPRVASNIGAIAEELLGLYPVQAAADALPGPLGIPLAPPVSRERVAAAAVSAALGLVEGRTALAGTDILVAASKRPPRTGVDRGVFDEEEATWERREDLKRRLFGLGPDGQDEAVAIMEELESLRPGSMRPIEDRSLNDRWDFVFDAEPNIGTAVIRRLIESPPPLIKPVFDLQDVRMEISEGRTIRIVVATKVLGRESDLVVTTSLLPDETDTDGTIVLERFEGVTLGNTPLGDVDLFIPDSWKRSRPLEISYLDEDMLIARSNAGDPHFLLRDK